MVKFSSGADIQQRIQGHGSQSGGGGGCMRSTRKQFMCLVGTRSLDAFMVV